MAKMNDSALIKTIEASSAPLTADQIAKSVKSLRHKVSPLLRNLVASGQIVEVPATGEFPVRFTFRQEVAGTQELPSDNVVQLSSPRRKDEDAKPVTSSTEPVVKEPARRGPGRPSLKAVGDKPTKAVATENKAPAEIKVSSAPEVSTVAPSPTPDTKSEGPAEAAEESMHNRVLRYLGEAGPTAREQLLMDLGPIGSLITEMKDKGLIESAHLFDSIVIDLLEAGQVELEKLPAIVKPQPEVVEAASPLKTQSAVEELSAAEEPAAVTEHVIADQPAPAPAEVVGRAAEEQVDLPLPEPVVESQAPAPIAAEPVKQPVQEQKAGDLPENPIMVEMAALMERLVNERMGKLTEKLEQGERDRDTLVKVGSSIKKATAALQIALDALNEIGDSIS